MTKIPSLAKAVMRHLAESTKSTTLAKHAGHLPQAAHILHAALDTKPAHLNKKIPPSAVASQTATYHTSVAGAASTSLTDGARKAPPYTHTITIAFSSKGNPTGHVSIGSGEPDETLQESELMGLSGPGYPRSGEYRRMPAQVNDSSNATRRQIRSEIGIEGAGARKTGDTDVTIIKIPATEHEHKLIQTALENERQKPTSENYTPLTKNCVDFVQHVFEQARPGEHFVDYLSADIGQHYGAPLKRHEENMPTLAIAKGHRHHFHENKLNAISRENAGAEYVEQLEHEIYSASVPELHESHTQQDWLKQRLQPYVDPKFELPENVQTLIQLTTTALMDVQTQAFDSKTQVDAAFGHALHKALSQLPKQQQDLQNTQQHNAKDILQRMGLSKELIESDSIKLKKGSMKKLVPELKGPKG